jgi:hypothetical protein
MNMMIKSSPLYRKPFTASKEKAIPQYAIADDELKGLSLEEMYLSEKTTNDYMIRPCYAELCHHRQENRI